MIKMMRLVEGEEMGWRLKWEGAVPLFFFEIENIFSSTYKTCTSFRRCPFGSNEPPLGPNF